MISEIRLRQFRCFEALDFQPGPARTCIVGQNAQGKTSILEAVCVLLRLQSPRTSSPSELIKAGESACSIEGWVDGTHLGMRDSLSVPHVYDLTAALTPGTIADFSSSEWAVTALMPMYKLSRAAAARIAFAPSPVAPMYGSDA